MAVVGELVAVSPVEHTMGGALAEYLSIKMHHLIEPFTWRRITVLGGYDRQVVQSRREKRDKHFNWQRPTAESIGDEILLKCFPGYDYVKHYGLIIKTYLALFGDADTEVVVVEPSEAACRSAIEPIDLDCRSAEVVIVGWGLHQLAGPDGWTNGATMSWKRETLLGRVVLWVGFHYSIWGDIAGRVVTRLAQDGARAVVYIGKVGGLRPGYLPNGQLASGSASMLSRQRVEWDDWFADAAFGDDVIRGLHITSPSILLETKPWLSLQTHGDFVDPEIGHMGLAATRAGIQFGYLHIISNNLTREFDHSLANERRGDVVARRAELLTAISGYLRGQIQRSN